MDNKDKSNPIHLEKIEVDGVYGSKILDDLVTKHFHELTEYKSKILEAKLALTLILKSFLTQNNIIPISKKGTGKSYKHSLDEEE